MRRVDMGAFAPRRASEPKWQSAAQHIETFETTDSVARPGVAAISLIPVINDL